MSTENNSNISQNESLEAVYDLIYLLGCAVNETAPDIERVAQMDLEQVHAFSVKHSLAAISCMALEDAYAGKLPKTELFQKWTEEKNRVIYKNLLFDMEREQVFSFLEDAGIWHLPLKGILIKDLYPKPGMRQMSDNDILFDAACREQVHEWFVGRGYEVESFQRSNHDVYQKKPVYNFEMHASLFGSQHEPAWQKYYANVRERMLPDDGCRYRYHLSDEDFYIYMMTHSCKHQNNGGTGLRSLLDCFVYNQAKKDGLDRAYICAEFNKLGIYDFEEKMHHLSQKLFDHPQDFSPAALTEEEAGLLSGFVSSGTYGTLSNRVRNRLKGMEEGGRVTGRTKLKYIRERLFPDPEFFRDFYPFFYRHRWLLPVGYLYRMIRGGIRNRRKLAVEIKTLAQKTRKDRT